MKDQVKLLIDILSDKNAREDERGDAAIDLRCYEDKRAIEALFEVASNPQEDDVIADNAAESLGDLCVKMHFFDEKKILKMPSFTQKIVVGYILSHNPSLIPQPLRIELATRLKLL